MRLLQFTFREPLAKCNGNEQTKPGQWCWLDTYPQHVYYDEKNNLEMIPVGTAINWNESLSFPVTQLYGPDLTGAQ